MLIWIPNDFLEPILENTGLFGQIVWSIKRAAFHLAQKYIVRSLKLNMDFILPIIKLLYTTTYILFQPFYDCPGFFLSSG